MKDDIEKLKKRISVLENENRLLRERMDEAGVSYNDIVSDEDIVYILGDVCMGDLESGINKLKQLKGHKHLIRGNHCTDNKVSRYIEENIFESIQYATMIKYKKYNFYLSHYQTYMGNYDMQMSKTWCLHGHTHSKFEFDDSIAKNFNVALDAHNCYPIEIDEILTKIQEKWNKIHNEYERQQSQLQKVKDMKIDEMLDF